MAAVRISIRWFGIRRSLTRRAAGGGRRAVGAEAKFLSAGKKLLDNTPSFKAVTTIRDKVISFWKSLSLPYPEPGIRLIRQDRIDDFAAKMREFQEELCGASTARKSSRRTGQPRHLAGLARRARPATTPAPWTRRRPAQPLGRFPIRSEALVAGHSWLEPIGSAAGGR